MPCQTFRNLPPDAIWHHPQYLSQTLCSTTDQDYCGDHAIWLFHLSSADVLMQCVRLCNNNKKWIIVLNGYKWSWRVHYTIEMFLWNYYCATSKSTWSRCWPKISHIADLCDICCLIFIEILHVIRDHCKISTFVFKSLQSPQSFQCMAQRFCTNIYIARGGKYKYFVTVLKQNVLGICNLLK